MRRRQLSEALLPRAYRDERAFAPFSSAPHLALISGRFFFLLPHDVRRTAASRVAPERFRALQTLRHAPNEAGYSLAPFDELRCIFVHIPKAAGVSVCTALFGGPAGGHASIGTYQLSFAKRDFASYFKFGFVRNPWDRLYSAYAFLRDGGMDESDRTWSRANMSALVTFEDFVLRWVNEQNVLTHIHFVPQYRFLCAPFSTRIAVDFVGRYEQLESDFSHVRQRLGLDASVTLPHHNRGPGEGAGRDYRRHYTAAMREVVERVYRADIKLFGYSFDPPGEAAEGATTRTRRPSMSGA